jgi:alpha-1,2-mannosyltransferase
MPDRPLALAHCGLATIDSMAVNEASLTAAERWSIAARRAGTHSLLILPPIALAVLLQASLQKGSLALDMVHAYIPAAHKVLHGHSPYPPLTVAALKPRLAFVYPPLTAWLVLPFAALPAGAAQGVGVALMIACVVGLLLLLGVRDWRCHMIAMLWVPTFAAVQTVNLALPVAVAVAAIWRYRNRPFVAGLLLGLLLALKLYLWPIGIWLIATHRVRAAVTAAMTAVVLVLGPWLPIGLSGLRTYPHLLHLVTGLERGDSYTLAALLAPATSWTVATILGVLGGLAVLALAWRRSREDERSAFVLAIAAMMMLTPIVWMSYFVLLLVVIGLYAKRFTWLWTLPLWLWVGPQVTNGSPWQTSSVLLIAAATVAVAVNRWGVSRLASAGPPSWHRS